MVRLSVNINKVALLRNSRGENYPNVIEFAKNCLNLGADGITVHPRPDERHIRFSDVYELSDLLKKYKKELNVEGYPSQEFIKMMEEIQPDQCTLVPDAPHVLTSNTGWDTRRHFSFLKEVVSHLKRFTRVSLFLNPNIELLHYAKAIETQRVELYTGPYAKFYPYNPHKAIEPYVQTAQTAEILEIGLNAGHDLNHENLSFFVQNVPNILEVSIGHAIISDCLYWGLEETLKKYKKCLKTS
jgi:pyridoxine 5-phosphate synthase